MRAMRTAERVETVCDNRSKPFGTMILDELQREFEAVRARAQVVRGYL